MAKKWYSVECVSIDVHDWDNENGQGNYICSKFGYTIAQHCETIEAARSELNDHFRQEIDDDFINGDLFMISQIENEDAYKDENGNYIADYLVRIIEHKPVVFNDGI